MPQGYAGALDASGLKFALVVSRFNDLFTDKLLEGAIDCLTRHGADPDDLDVIVVPGSFEVPLAAKTAAETGRYHAVVCIAAVIRGATPHFDLVAGEIAKGVAQVGLSTGVPTTFGVLTTDTLEQALERSGSKAGNKGWDAASAAVEMVNLLQVLRGADGETPAADAGAAAGSARRGRTSKAGGARKARRARSRA